MFSDWMLIQFAPPQRSRRRCQRFDVQYHYPNGIAVTFLSWLLYSLVRNQIHGYVVSVIVSRLNCKACGAVVHHSPNDSDMITRHKDFLSVSIDTWIDIIRILAWVVADWNSLRSIEVMKDIIHFLAWVAAFIFVLRVNEVEIMTWPTADQFPSMFNSKLKRTQLDFGLGCHKLISF